MLHSDRDVFVSSYTGSGKTLAATLAIIRTLIYIVPKACWIAPTKVLAQQAADLINTVFQGSYRAEGVKSFGRLSRLATHLARSDVFAISHSAVVYSGDTPAGHFDLVRRAKVVYVDSSMVDRRS